jgi:7,8-dihydropterin-6-yl-methyl-4-(beta-D-ribofuranosyl)aminobenzene 5'-phosphate synthase
MAVSSKVLAAAAVLALSVGGIVALAEIVEPRVPAGATLRFTVLYDNYLHQEGTKPDWGFSCLIEGAEKTILFDTGTDPHILKHNIDALKVDLKKVDLVVLSHDHGDHVGGMPAVLAIKPDVTVYYPVSFPAEIGEKARAAGARTLTVDKPVEICQHVHVTGEMGDRIKETSLVLDTPGGLVVVTGCSHPGIVGILERAREIVDKPIQLVFGGFHLGDMPDAQVQKIIADLKRLGVERCGATHCTGDRPIALFKAAFGDKYVPVGTGRVIEGPGY